VALYAAYGSNMDPAQMAERCPHSPQAGTGWLEGWRLTFGGEDIGWEGALATVVEDADGRVFVVLYEVSENDEQALDRWDGATLGYYSKVKVIFVVLYEVSENDEQALDRWDGATLGYYSKVKVRVATLEGDAVAWLYVLNDYEGGLPSARYLGIMADAAESAGAPADYVDWLRTRPCTSMGA